MRIRFPYARGFHLRLPASVLAVLFLSLLLSGCSSVRGMFGSSEPVAVPAELKPVSAELNPTRIWQSDAGAGSKKFFIKLRAALADGRVYTADVRGAVSAFDAASGERLWSTDLDLPLSAGPGVGDGLVLVGSSQGDVVALDPSNGAERWRARVASEVLSRPVSAAGITAVRTTDGKLYALRSDSGETAWIYDRSVPVLSLRGTSAPLMVGDGLIAGFDNGRLAALTLAGGQVAWERVLATPSGRTELQRMVDIDADPVLDGNDLFAVSFQGQIAALDPRNGEILWQREMSSHAGLAVDATAVYVTDESSHVWALDRRSGSTLWKQTDLQHRRLTAPVVQGRYVVVGDFEGYLHWLSKDDGRIVGRLQVDDDGIAAAPVTASDTLYYLGRGGRVGAVTIR